jgi:hypothetical protein
VQEEGEEAVLWVRAEGKSEESVREMAGGRSISITSAVWSCVHAATLPFRYSYVLLVLVSISFESGLMLWSSYGPSSSRMARG